MLLAVDVGNTEITIVVFQGQELAQHWRAATVAERTADDLEAQAGLLVGACRGVAVARDRRRAGDVHMRSTDDGPRVPDHRLVR